MFPRHDDFAVRNVGLPGMIGALGACFGTRRDARLAAGASAGRVQLGRDAVARAGARHHPAAVEPARAALAHRRHLGLRGEARARPEWGREMDIPFARAIDRGQVMKLKDLNSGFTNPEDDLAGLLPVVAGRRAHRRGLRPAEAAGARASRTATGIDTETAIKQVLGVDIDALQKTLRRVPRAALRHAAQGAGGARRGCRPDMPLDALRATGRGEPRQLPGAARAGHGAEEDGAGRGPRGVRTRRGAGARMPRAPTARRRRLPRWRSPVATRRARSRRSTR